MARRDLAAMSKEELIRELEALDNPAGFDVHQPEPEMATPDLRQPRARTQEVAGRREDLYDSAPVADCTLDRAGRILELNVAATTLLGASRTASIGRLFPSVAPLDDDRPFHVHMGRCLTETGPVTSELTFRADGSGTKSIRIISGSTPGQDQATTTYRTVLLDISDLRATENRLELLSVAGERLSSPEYAAVIDAAARVVVPALADLCIMDLATESGIVERKLVYPSSPATHVAVVERLMHLSPPPGEQTVQAEVTASGLPILLGDAAEVRGRLGGSDDDAATLATADSMSVMVVPLTARERTLGALTLASSRPGRRHSRDDLQVAQELAGRIAIALDNAKLYADERRANEALRRSEATATGIVSISADAIISIDENQRITSFNEGAEKIFGYSNAEAIGTPLDTLLPVRFSARHRRHVESFVAGGEAARRMGDRRETICGLRKNGEEFPADAAISRLAVGGKNILTVALRDVSDQRRIVRDQRLLAEVGLVLAATLDYDETLTRLTQLIVRTLADYCIVDVVEDDGEIRRVRVVGRDPAKQWVCDSLSRITIDRSRPHVVLSSLEGKRSVLIENVTSEIVASLAQTAENLPAFEGLEARSIIAVPLLVRGNALGVLELVSSTGVRPYQQADLRLAEEVAFRAALAIENARLYRAAERAISARDSVLGVVAHDLRGPLGNILMQAELLRADGPGPARSPSPADAIERAASHMTRLIRDLLDITCIEAGSLSIGPVRVDAGRFLGEFVEAQALAVSSTSHDLRLDVAPSLGEVMADRDRLLQVLENLVANACKFTGPHGRVTVGATPRGGEVLFWVRDTGVGIDVRDLPHLFDRFWQASKADRRGVGLGLPIVKGIVDAHGGRIWVESHLGVGSTFFFTLPRARSEPAMAAMLSGRRSAAGAVADRDSQPGSR
jgi:PAS domain S-box-containing protein